MMPEGTIPHGTLPGLLAQRLRFRATYTAPPGARRLTILTLKAAVEGLL